jgi:DNA-binding GntR family transcriptional regulator
VATVNSTQRETLKIRTYEELRRLLMAGYFAPGEQLTVRLLSERLDSTIMPVREAVQRLVAEGALVSLPNRRIYVPKLTRAEFHDLMEIRQLLEPAACARAAERATTAVIEAVKAEEKTLANMLRKDVNGRVHSSNMNFHFFIYNAAESPHLVHLIESVWLRIGPIIFYPGEDEARRKSYFDRERTLHRELVKALWRRDRRDAQEIMGKILSATEEFHGQHFPFAS